MGDNEAIDPQDGGPYGPPLAPEEAVDHLAARSLAHNAFYKLGRGASPEEVQTFCERLAAALGLDANVVTEAGEFYTHTYGDAPS